MLPGPEVAAVSPAINAADLIRAEFGRQENIRDEQKQHDAPPALQLGEQQQEEPADFSRQAEHKQQTETAH